MSVGKKRMAKILFKNGRIWNGEAFVFSDVLIDGNKILKIRPFIEDNAELIIDAAGKTVSAGLIDIHTHLENVSDDCFGVSPDTGCIPFGVTSCADASGIHGDEALLKSMSVNAKVFILLGPDSRDEDFKNTEDAIKKYGSRVAGIKTYLDSAISDLASTRPLERVIDFAHQKGLPVMVHWADSKFTMSQLLDILKSGDIITHAYHTGKNTALSDGFKAIRQAKKRGVVIDTGFAGHVNTDFYVLKKAIENGAFPDTISSDLTKLSSCKRGGNYGLPMCMSFLRHLGMDEDKIFRAVTSRPAEVLRIDGGFLKEGLTADICLLEYSDEGFSLTDSSGNTIENSQGYRCLMTVAKGEVVYINKKHAEEKI